MVGGKVRVRMLAVVMLGAGWFACSSNEYPGSDQSADGPVASTRQALDPGWTPGSLDPSAWYVASAADVGVTSGAVTTWTEHRHNGRDLTAYGSPQFSQTGWLGSEPTVTLNAHNLFALTQNYNGGNWPDGPAGTDAAFSVLAVIRSASSVPQTASIASWWDPYGSGAAWVGVKAQDGRTLLDMGREYALANIQVHNSAHDLGTDPGNAPPHVVAWRYSPESQVLKLTVDGISSTSSSPRERGSWS